MHSQDVHPLLAEAEGKTGRRQIPRAHVFSHDVPEKGFSRMANEHTQPMASKLPRSAQKLPALPGRLAEAYAGIEDHSIEVQACSFPLLGA